MDTSKLWQFADIAEAGGKQHWSDEMRLAAAEIQRLHAVDNAAHNVCHAIGSKQLDARLRKLLEACGMAYE